MKKHRIAFVDLETTGLDPLKHEIIEIGIVLADQHGDLFGEQTLEFISEHEIRLTPEHIETADPVALKVSRYHERDWSHAVAQKDGIATAVKLIEGCVFVGQNVAFDWSFLICSGKTYGIDIDSKVHYHKLDLASMAFGKLYHDKRLRKFSLREMADYFGVVNHDAHTALADARATFEVCKKLLASSSA